MSIEVASRIDLRVVRSVTEFQRNIILDRLERAETVEAIRRGIEQTGRGEGIPLEEAKKRLRKKHGFSS